MFRSLSDWFYRIASWKTLLLGIVLYVPFPAYFLKNLENEMNTLAGKAIGPIDLLILRKFGKWLPTMATTPVLFTPRAK